LRQHSKDIYNDKQIRARLLEELKKRNLEGWVIEYNDANGGNVSIYETEKRVVIRTGVTETKLSLECVLSHELDGHAIQAFNAMANKSTISGFYRILEQRGNTKDMLPS
jgi:hypothetical protein